MILEAADILRSKGFHADATNQFDEVLTEYDTTNLDVVVFGGMVPPDTKQYLREEISKVNGHVTFVQGLAGIAGLIAAQVEGVTSTAGDDNGVAYDPRKRTVQLTLQEPAQVVVEAWWATSFTPPEPTSTSMRVIDRHFDFRRAPHSTPRRGSARGVVRHRVRRASRPRVHGWRDARGSDAHGSNRRPDPASRAPRRPSGGDPQHRLTLNVLANMARPSVSEPKRSAAGTRGRALRLTTAGRRGGGQVRRKAFVNAG